MGYKYKAQCYVCGMNYPANELKKRWDGKMVCPKDWETRNILDFYKPRNDAHKLPWTQPELDQSGHEFTTWTPTLSDPDPALGQYSMTGSYKYDTTTKLFEYDIRFSWNTTISPTGGRLGADTLCTLPAAYTLATDKGGTCVGTLSGTFYSPVSFFVATQQLKIPNAFTTRPYEGLIIRGSFVTT